MARRNPYAGPDHRTLEARSKGYPARSVFKLEEIDRRCQLLAPGKRVIDLGAAPGSWSLYVQKRIGAEGRLLAVDLQVIDVAFAPNVHVLHADAFALPPECHAEHGPYDVVLSDMAPRTTGDKFANAARSTDLFLLALGVAQSYGVEGSAFVGKLFMGADFQQTREQVAAAFTSVKVVKPKGTRDSSVEVFLVGLGKKTAPSQLP